MGSGQQRRTNISDTKYGVYCVRTASSHQSSRRSSSSRARAGRSHQRQCYQPQFFCLGIRKKQRATMQLVSTRNAVKQSPPSSRRRAHHSASHRMVPHRTCSPPLPPAASTCTLMRLPARTQPCHSRSWKVLVPSTMAGRCGVSSNMLGCVATTFIFPACASVWRDASVSSQWMEIWRGYYLGAHTWAMGCWINLGRFRCYTPRRNVLMV